MWEIGEAETLMLVSYLVTGGHFVFAFVFWSGGFVMFLQAAMEAFMKPTLKSIVKARMKVVMKAVIHAKLQWKLDERFTES